MAKKIIMGIDSNLRSTGWAIAEEENGKLKLKKAGYIKQKASEKSNEDRRNAKSIRKQYRRKVSKKQHILHFFITKGWLKLPIKNLRKNFQKASWLSTKQIEKDPILFAIKKFINLDTWQLRIDALEGKKLTLKELARIIYQLSMRKGFPEASFRSASSGQAVKKGDKQSGAIEKTQGAEQTSVFLKEQSHPYYAYLAKLLPTQGVTYKDFEKTGHHRIRNRYTYRSIYEAEFHAIWKQQAKHHPSLNEKDKKILYHHLFYQMPLKAPEKGFCRLEPQQTRALKSSLLFEKYNAYLFANNFVTSLNKKPAGNETFIKLRDRIVRILEEKKEKLTIQKLKEKATISYYTNYKLNSKVPAAMPITAQFIDIFGKKRWQEDFSQKECHDIWHVVCQEEAKIKPLQKLAKKYELDEASTKKLLEDFDIPLSSQGVAKYSTKALKKLLPYIEEGYTEDKATLLAGIPYTFSTKDEKGQNINHWKNLSSQKREEIIQQVKNEIFSKPAKLYEAYQALLTKYYSGKVNFENSYNPTYISKEQKDQAIQTRNPNLDSSLNLNRKVIKAAKQNHQKIDQINIEMARKLRQSKEDRTKEMNDNLRNQRNNDMAISWLQENKFPATKNNIVKYKLWKECGYTCIYSGDTMPAEKVFGGKSDTKEGVDIEHIIPRNPDDSRLINLTLSYRTENRKKDKRIPYEAFKHNPDKWEAIQKRAKCFFKGKRERFLAEKYPDEPFLKGTGDLTGYISKETAKMAKFHTEKVLCTKGGVVSTLRETWALDELLAPPLIMDPDTPIGQGTLVYTEKTWSPDQVTPEKEVHFFELAQSTFEGRELKDIKKELYQAKRTLKDDSKNKELKEKVEHLKQELKDAEKALTNSRKAFEKAVKEKAEKAVDKKKKINKASILYEEGYVEFCEKKEPHEHYIDGDYIACSKEHKYFFPIIKKNRKDERHHIIDACVIAMINAKQNFYYNNLDKQMKKNKEEKSYPLPYSTFREDLIHILKTTFLVYRTKHRGLEERKTKSVQVANYPEAGKNPGKLYRWEKIKNTMTPRGQLHDETIYGKNELEAKFVIRKKAEEGSFKDKKPVNQAFHGLPSDLIQKGEKNDLYKFYLKNKQKGGDPVPIKTLRIFNKDQNPIPLKNHRYVMPGDNYLLAIYYDDQVGRYKDTILSFYDFIKLQKEGTCIKKYFKEKNIKPRLVIRKGDYFLLNFPKDASLDDRELVSNCLYRAVSIFRDEKQSQYRFVRHLRTSRSQLLDSKDECIVQSTDSFMKMQPRKVLFDILGNLIEL